MGERSNGKRITYRPWNPRESHDTCFLYQADVLGTWYSTAPYVKLFDTAFGHSSGYFLNDISRVLPVVKGIMLAIRRWAAYVIRKKCRRNRKRRSRQRRKSTTAQADVTHKKKYQYNTLYTCHVCSTLFDECHS